MKYLLSRNALDYIIRGGATYDNIRIKRIQEYLQTAEEFKRQIEIAEEYNAL